eukprot:932177-Pyramimonas_sp.AAC.1
MRTMMMSTMMSRQRRGDDDDEEEEEKECVVSSPPTTNLWQPSSAAPKGAGVSGPRVARGEGRLEVGWPCLTLRSVEGAAGGGGA